MSEDTSTLVHNGLHDDISALIDSFDYLYVQARIEIIPKMRPILSTIALAEVVERVLDQALSFVTDAQIDSFFLKVCNRYRDIYPEVISAYEQLRAEMLCEDDETFGAKDPDESIDSAFDALTSSARRGTLPYDSPPEASPSDGDADQPGAFLSSAEMKPPLSYDAQLDHLVNRGLLVSDYGRQFAKECLADMNYYRLRGYWMTLQQPSGRFIPGTTMNDIVEIAHLDSDMRHWLLEQVERVEIRLRSSMAHCLGTSYGPRAFENQDAFDNASQFEGMRRQIERETQYALRARKPFVVHTMQRYGALPAWAAVELMTLGVISRAYGNLKSRDIARAIATDFETSPYYLNSWLEHITYVRNICAHFDRFYNRKMTKQARLYDNMRQYASNKQFPTFLVVARLVSKGWPDDWPLEFERLKGIFEIHPSVDLAPMAFPQNWKHVLWNAGVPGWRDE